MLLHTDLLTTVDMHDAARIAHVDFLSDIEEKGSRTRLRRFKFRLQGWTSHRYMNSGRFGAQVWDGNAATWDEWGIFLNVLFQRDPEAHCGKYSYAGLLHFKHQTGGRFDDLAHADQHANHNWKWDAVNNQRDCPCGAVLRHDSPDGLMVVKHGIVTTTDPATVDRWLTSTPVQRATEREHLVTA